MSMSGIDLGNGVLSVTMHGTVLLDDKVAFGDVNSSADLTMDTSHMLNKFDKVENAQQLATTFDKLNIGADTSNIYTKAEVSSRIDAYIDNMNLVEDADSPYSTSTVPYVLTTADGADNYRRFQAISYDLSASGKMLVNGVEQPVISTETVSIDGHDVEKRTHKLLLTSAFELTMDVEGSVLKAEIRIWR